MKRLYKIVILTLVSSLLLTACSGGSPEKKSERPTIYCSTYPVWDFTQKLAGDFADVKLLVPAGAEMHDWEPGPADIVELGKADMLVLNGAGLEEWADDVLESLDNKENIKVVYAAEGLKLLEGMGHEHKDEHDDHNESESEAHAHDHEHGVDPHVWMSPVMAKTMFLNIYDALSAIYTGHSQLLTNKLNEYTAKLDELDEAFKEATLTLKSRDLVVSHAAFTYLAAEYDLQQIAIEGLTPDSEPTPQRMAEIIEYLKKNGIKFIYFESGSNMKVAEAIAKEALVDILTINNLESLTIDELDSGDDYFSVMYRNLEAIKKGLD